MKNLLQRKHGGTYELSWIQPTCSCGWEGRKEFAYNDYQHSNVIEQEEQHVRTAHRAEKMVKKN